MSEGPAGERAAKPRRRRRPRRRPSQATANHTERTKHTDRVARALQLLQQELEAQLNGSGPHRRSGSVDLELRLDVPLNERSSRESAAAVRAALRRAAQGMRLRDRLAQAGPAFCLRCASASCEHASPDHFHSVFVGYGPSGLPRFQDFAQFLLERSHAQVGDLFEDSSTVVAEVVGESEIYQDLLPAYADGSSVRVLGQVCAGWFVPRGGPGPSAAGGRRAFTFQLLALGRDNDLVLRVVAGVGHRDAGHRGIRGAAPDEELEALQTLVLDLSQPWSDALRRAERSLADLSKSLRGGARLSGEQLELRRQGLLEELARELVRHRRSTRRRTQHAEERRQARRPTGKALADLEAARDEDVLWDARRETLVVLGERGRAHVFNERGLLVTSIQYTPQSIRRRRDRGMWKLALPEQIARLRVAALG